MARIELYDTTLRDGSQGEGVYFSLQDKLAITSKLDELGFDYIEGGYPLSNPKDYEYFQQVRKLPLEYAKVVAFGMTRRKGVSAEDDIGMQALMESQAPVITIVGKTWDLHVREVLGVDEAENLAMIHDSISYLKSQGREVIYDAEHFFDGYAHNPEFALRTIQQAEKAGAKLVVLCDTNGGTLPELVSERVKAARGLSRSPSGSIATTTASWRWQIRWRRSMRARCRCKGRSTGSGSGAGMWIWSAWRQICCSRKKDMRH
jgi:2-isopropylmalate synthase